MKKIVYCISTLKKTGPSIVLYNLVKNLDLTKYKPIIVTLSPEVNNSMIKDFQDLNIEIIQLNLNRLKGILFGGLILKKTIEKINPDIIHCNGFRDILLVGIFVNKKYKKIVTIHSDFAIDYVLRYGFEGKIMFFLQKFIIKNFSYRIAVSKLLSDILNKKYPKIKFDYVDNGIDTEKFKPIGNKTELRKKLNLPMYKKVFIWCGTFIDIKNPALLVKAIKKIKNKDLFFILCGARGYLFETCKKEFENNKNVLFPGYVSNIEEYLQASDYYISTSLSEGFHLSLYEALACGLPVILTDIRAYSELKKQDIGFFLKKEDIDNLIKNINDILTIDYNLYSQKIINVTKYHFSAELMSKKYQHIYNKF